MFERSGALGDASGTPGDASKSDPERARDAPRALLRRPGLPKVGPRPNYIIKDKVTTKLRRSFDEVLTKF